MQLQNKVRKLVRILPTQVGKRRIVRFIWSAILDKKTCPLCRKLDGMVIDASSEVFTKLHPPIHQGCRCLWIGVCGEDIHIPPMFHPKISPDLMKYASLKNREAKEKVLSIISKKPPEITEDEYLDYTFRYGTYGWSTDPKGNNALLLRMAADKGVLNRDYNFAVLHKLRIKEIEKTIRELKEKYKEVGSVIEKAARRMYSETQRVLKGKRLTLYRGTKVKNHIVDSISSWTSDINIAKKFAGKRGYIIKIEIDPKHIFTSYKTHPDFFYYRDEKEYIVFDEALKDPNTKIEVFKREKL